jgi:hypothetical protein
MQPLLSVCKNPCLWCFSCHSGILDYVRLFGNQCLCVHLYHGVAEHATQHKHRDAQTKECVCAFVIITMMILVVYLSPRCLSGNSNAMQTGCAFCFLLLFMNAVMSACNQVLLHALFERTHEALSYIC